MFWGLSALRPTCLLILGTFLSTCCFFAFSPLAKMSQLSVTSKDNNNRISLKRLNSSSSLAAFEFLTQHENLPWNDKVRSEPVFGRQKSIMPQRRVVHLDLKGAPPQIQYLAEVFPLIRQAGANTLLIEYEDMFPFNGVLSHIPARNHYTPEDLSLLLELAANHSLSVIPLVQTLGHMEHILKLEDFVDIREHSRFPQSICPSKNESLVLIKTVVDQVVKFHRDAIQYLHIGCDEVSYLGVCPTCQSTMKKIDHVEQGAGTPRRLYLEHIKQVAEYVRDKHAIKVLIWDDMIRSIPTAELKGLGLGTLVEPVIWVYAENVDHFLDVYTWRKYVGVFQNLWVAGAFKGAFGERLLVPPLARHRQNQESWLKAIKKHRPYVNFRGIVLTGWSRYDHFASLCELLPTSIPSLIQGLATISTPANDHTRLKIMAKILNCPLNYRQYSGSSPNEPQPSPDFEECSFPGSKVFLPIVRLDRLKGDLFSLHAQTTAKGWLTPYHVRHNFTSTWRLLEMQRKYLTLDRALTALGIELRSALSPIFDQFTISEWMEQNVEEFQSLTQATLLTLESLLTRTVWSPRPVEAELDVAEPSEL